MTQNRDDFNRFVCVLAFSYSRTSSRDLTSSRFMYDIWAYTVHKRVYGHSTVHKVQASPWSAAEEGTAEAIYISEYV